MQDCADRITGQPNFMDIDVTGRFLYTANGGPSAGSALIPLPAFSPVFRDRPIQRLEAQACLDPLNRVHRVIR